LLRTHTCGSLRKEHIGTTVSLAGWVNRRRDHGGLIFIDLRDREGIVQTVFNPEISPMALKIAEQLRNEYVVALTGDVSPRPAGTENPRIPTGDIEVTVKEVQVLNTSNTPPFYVNEEVEVDENVRLKYRYLDLRRPRLLQTMMLRHRVIRFMHDFLDARGFIEVETPILIKSTPEGARDYLVPSRIHPGCFYALPQSPQQLKQILMVAGLEKYYQIARCFRDEDTRADRQPEFTQLDIEMSFVNENDVLGLTEEMFTTMVKTLTPEKRMILPFPRLTYAAAMERYGSDKPDLRFGMEIKDLSDIVAGTEFGVFQKALDAGGRIKGICAGGCAGYTRRQLDDLNEIAKTQGAGGLVTMALDSAAGSLDTLTADMVKSAAAKFLTLEQVRDMARRLEAVPGDLLLIVAGESKLVNTVLGELRREMGSHLGLTSPDLLAFAFIVEFPMFERNSQTGRLEAMHHAFTMPREEDMSLLDTDPEKVRAKSYDIVCNGRELGSGSIRIHWSDLQKKIFRILGYNDAEIDERFGHLLEAFNYGAPPHGGIAPGIDRIIMRLTGTDNIRDVVAFPKNQSAVDLTFNAPAPVTKEQLKELHIRLSEKD
jgi:aspartyl-tRNA synthetase